NKAEEECLTTRDRLFYWFRHANEFKEKPAWLDDPETRALLNATEIAAFTPEKKEIYNKDMKNEQDIEYEKSICYNEGLAEGREKGREEGLAEKALSDAKNLLAEGISPETIARCTGISLEDVKALRV
ncbi:MAG: hypothetical protein ACI4UJ_00590, partial [Candidatus Cryptobacteroides sp.]